MATSPNFNWPEPDNTDLVKNGALAIRTAVNAIDTSLVDLKGGTTGQVLAKASGTDMDFSWVAQDDANAIQNTQLTAKGALISAVSAGTPVTLTVGTNDQVLTADSTTASGLKWATPASSTPTYVGSFVYNSTDQNVTNNTYTALTYNTEFFDTDSFHSTSSNTSRMTIPTGKGGYYQVYAAGAFGASTTGDKQLFIRKNNTDIFFSGMGSYNQGRNNVFISGTINCAAGDYLEIFAYQNSGGTLDIGGGTRFNFGVDYLGA